MKICVDKNHLLVIENENIPQVKEYTYHVGGYLFSDFDKWIIVLNKKVWKIINLKNLSDNMNVVRVRDEWRVASDELLDLASFEDALRIFQGFDEESGEKYFFLPGFSEKELAVKNEILKKLGSKVVLKKTEKGVITSPLTPLQFLERGTFELGAVLSFLLGLVVLYGKFAAKWWELQSCKIQLPLFGQYLKFQEKLDEMVKNLQAEWMFFVVDRLQTNNGIIYQVSCTDWEVLELFAKWYEPVEKFEKITKRDFTEEMKKSLLEFVKNDSQIPEEGKGKVMGCIEKGVLKLLVK